MSAAMYVLMVKILCRRRNTGAGDSISCTGISILFRLFQGDLFQPPRTVAGA